MESFTEPPLPPALPPALPLASCALSWAQVRGKCKRSCWDISVAVQRGGECVHLLGDYSGSAAFPRVWCKEHGQAFCSTVRWEIRTCSEVPSGSASNANETTAGRKQSQLVVQHGNKTFATGSVKWTSGKTLSEWPPGWWLSSKSLPKTNPEHLLMWVRGNALSSPWHPTVPSCSKVAQFCILQAGSCSGCCGQALHPPAEYFSVPKNKGLTSFAKDIPNHSPHLSSPIYIQLGGVAARWVNSWFRNPQDFQAKVPGLWQASLSAPLPACICCGSKQEQTASAKGLCLCWH